jgi:hypothetical protein
MSNSGNVTTTNIRNDIDLSEAREYITDNPKKWYLDKNNPENCETQRIANNV